jgi:hypothetical protein
MLRDTRLGINYPGTFQIVAKSGRAIGQYIVEFFEYFLTECRYILPDLMDVDVQIKTRESISGRGAWHPLLPFLTFKKAWAARYAILPVYLIAFNEEKIGHDPNPNTLTILRVVPDRRDNCRSTTGAQLRRDFFTETSTMSEIFTVETGRFIVTDTVLRQSQWLSTIVNLINNKIIDLFSWAGPTRSIIPSVLFQSLTVSIAPTLGCSLELPSTGHW